MDKLRPRRLAPGFARAALAVAPLLLSSPLAAQLTTLTVPSSASIHGQSGAFFHTDLWAMDRSFSNPIPVTFTYRCFAGPCPTTSTAASFTLTPRRSRIFTDIVATLFKAPETAGAIELTWDASLGQISATTRVFTPEIPAPTFGTGIPAFPSNAALDRAIFLGLGNNGGSLSAGFRSNAGAYNPNANAVVVTFQLLGASGATLGSPFTLPLGPNQAGQVNDVFARAGVGSTVSTNVSLRATATAAVFFNVTVIDNQSGDSVFVFPSLDRENAVAPPDTQTIPASASIHGRAGTFFHTDLWVRNGSVSSPLTVSARLRCSVGTCPSDAKTINLGPGETKLYSDAVGTLFGAPEAAGAIELTPTVGSGKLFATSRTYTPSLPAPTNGTAIPGLPLADVKTIALFLGLGTNGGDVTSGFRTNAGAYNPLPFSVTITFYLYSGTGALLGQKDFLWGPNEAKQINDVFAALGAPGAVTRDAYLVMVATLPILPYATVIDNQSGDSIYVRPTDDEAKPQQ
jgi:hypothetical protein